MQITQQLFYLAATAFVTGNAAKSAAVRKEIKYVELSNTYHFLPIAIELHGPLSNKATSFFYQISVGVLQYISQTPGKKAFFFNESLCLFKVSMLFAFLILSMIYLLMTLASLVNAHQDNIVRHNNLHV